MKNQKAEFIQKGTLNQRAKGLPVGKAKAIGKVAVKGRFTPKTKGEKNAASFL